MEKKYMKPAIEVQLLETEEMIAASIENGFNADDITGTDETSGNLSRDIDDLLFGNPIGL